MTADRIARIALRVALGAAFLSAVASRVGLWGPHAGDPGAAFAAFREYVGELNPWLPGALRTPLAGAVTLVETSLGVALVAGVRVRWASLGAAGLLAVFATAMTAFTGPKSALDYSVWSAAAGALLLWTMSPPAAAQTRSGRRSIMSEHEAETARAYYEAFARKDVADIARRLHPDVRFTGPLAELTGREAVVEAAGRLLVRSEGLRIRASFGGGGEAVVVYDLSFPDPIGVCRTAALLAIEQGLITRIELFYDGRPFERHLDRGAIFASR